MDRLVQIGFEKFSFIGNTSIAGAYLSLLSQKMREEAEEIAGKIRAMGRKSLALKIDVANFDEVQAGVKKAEKELAAL